MENCNFNQKYLKIKSEILTTSRKIDKLPPGKLVCTHNGKYIKWYSSQDGVFTYIPKKKRHYAEQLAIKKYLKAQLHDLKQEEKALTAYLARHNPEATKAQSLLERPEYQELLQQYFKPVSRELLEWMDEPYETNKSHPESLIYPCPSGHIVRSKSETIIDSLLYQAKIPFRYECAMEINGIVFHPDFSLRHPDTGRSWWWEHFGMMDAGFYSNEYTRKMQLYLNNGIIPDINLITTYETRDHPLTHQIVQEKVDWFLAHGQ